MSLCSVSPITPYDAAVNSLHHLLSHFSVALSEEGYGHNRGDYVGLMFLLLWMEHGMFFPPELDLLLEDVTDVLHIQIDVTFIVSSIAHQDRLKTIITYIVCTFTGDLFTAFQISDYFIEDIQIER